MTEKLIVTAKNIPYIATLVQGLQNLRSKSDTNLNQAYVDSGLQQCCVWVP